MSRTPSRKTILTVACVLAAASLGQHSALAAEDTYRVIEVPRLVPNFPVNATHLNDQGEIIGVAEIGQNHLRPVFWSHFVITDLNEKYGDQIGAAIGLNDRSEIVGTGASGPFILRRGRVELLTGLASGFTPASANAVNNRGEVALQTFPTDETTRVGRWFRGTVQEVAPADYNTVVAMNNAGAICGVQVRHSGIEPHITSYVWANGVLTEIGVLPGGQDAVVFDINDRGQVIGSSSFRTFIWEAGVSTEISLRLPGSGPGQSYAINDSSVIVGTALSKAVIWRDGVTRDLASLIDRKDPLYGKVKLLLAQDINGAGEILALGGDKNSHQYLLRPMRLPNLNP